MQRDGVSFDTHRHEMASLGGEPRIQIRGAFPERSLLQSRAVWK